MIISFIRGLKKAIQTYLCENLTALLTTGCAILDNKSCNQVFVTGRFHTALEKFLHIVL